MPATNQNIRDLFALTGNNPTVTNGQLTRLLVDFVYQGLKNITIYCSQDKAVQTARARVTF
jgi:hypothetical protein